eukprot:214596_1
MVLFYILFLQFFQLMVYHSQSLQYHYYLLYHINVIIITFNILLEITLILFTIIVIGMSIKTSMLIYFTLIIMVNYFIFNIPFLKTYLIWQYMYQPARYINFDFIITHSNNNIETIVNRLYARIHCMSHDIKWKWLPDENTKLLKYDKGTNKLFKLRYHEMDSCECWRLQYKFMKLNLKMKKK